MQSACQYAEEFYLEYFNHGISIERMAERHNISEELATSLIVEGRKINRLNAK